jgi:hypothetical protein
MKFSDLIANEIYAVVPSWTYSSRDKKDPDRVRKNDVVKSKLVSLQKYNYQVIRSHNPLDVAFVKATKGERSVGYLFEANDDRNNQTIYFLARPQDIVASWASIEPRWQKEELEEKQREAQQKAEAFKAEEERRIANANRERLETSLRETLSGILGSRVTDSSVQFDTTNVKVNDEYKRLAVVQIELSLVQSLLEKVLEAKDMVA